MLPSFLLVAAIAVHGESLTPLLLGQFTPSDMLPDRPPRFMNVRTLEIEVPPDLEKRIKEIDDLEKRIKEIEDKIEAIKKVRPTDAKLIEDLERTRKALKTLAKALNEK